MGWRDNVEIGAGASSGLIAIEKGSLEKQIGADLRISEVELEVLASP